MNKSELKQLIREEIEKIQTQPIYTVWIQTDDRFDRNFLVRANSEEEALEVAKNDDDISWDEKITNYASNPIDQDFLDTWEDEDFYIKFINDPSITSYLYDAGT